MVEAVEALVTKRMAVETEQRKKKKKVAMKVKRVGRRKSDAEKKGPLQREKENRSGPAKKHTIDRF